MKLKHMICLLCLLPLTLLAQQPFEIRLKVVDTSQKINMEGVFTYETYRKNSRSYEGKLFHGVGYIRDTIAEPNTGMLSLPRNKGFLSYKLVVDPGSTFDLIYNANIDSLIIVTNSKSDSILRKVFYKGADELSAIKQAQLNLHKQLIAANETLKADSVLSLIDHFEDDLHKLAKNIAYSNPNSIISPYILKGNKIFGIEEQQIYENLTEEVKQSEYGIELKKNMDDFFNNSIPKEDIKLVNEALIPIVGNTLDHHSILLNSSYFKASKSKYTIIEFWASWCIPCREFLKKLYPLYYQYKAKGLQVILVSLDDDPNQWEQASRTDNYPWLNISDGKGKNSEIPRNYNINAIPANIIVNAEGKIVARNVRSLDKIKRILETK